MTLRASQEEDEDDGEDFESDYEESYHLAPEEVNKAPVFVPYWSQSLPNLFLFRLGKLTERGSLTLESLETLSCFLLLVDHYLFS